MFRIAIFLKKRMQISNSHGTKKQWGPLRDCRSSDLRPTATLSPKTNKSGLVFFVVRTKTSRRTCTLSEKNETRAVDCYIRTQTSQRTQAYTSVLSKFCCASPWRNMYLVLGLPMYVVPPPMSDFHDCRNGWPLRCGASRALPEPGPGGAGWSNGRSCADIVPRTTRRRNYRQARRRRRQGALRGSSSRLKKYKK